MIRIGAPKKSTGTSLLAYPGFAYPDGNVYQVSVSGMAWRTPVKINRRQKMMIRVLGGVMHASPEDLQSELFRTRIEPFMAEAHHRLSIVVTINGIAYRLKKPTRRNGRFFGWLSIPKSKIESCMASSHPSIDYVVSFDDENVTPAEGTIHIYDSNGISVVTDIDDTIKDSKVGDKRALLANTFLKEFRSVDGMAGVYNQWSNCGASFHYVSSSPWQLFESLEEMTGRCGFPPGTMHLRNFRLRDQFLKKVMLISRKGKTTAIKTLMRKMPGRKFVFVGDSGERDAKIYRRICLKYPHRIKGVFIRNLKNHPLKKGQLEKLQKALPDGISGCFSSAQELSDKAQSIF